MHPTLSLVNLAQLGPSDRELATSAANGSLKSLRRVAELVATDHSPLHSRPDLFGPVFFANLDPLGIPSPDQLKSNSFPVDSPILRAVLSLKALSLRNAGKTRLLLAPESFKDVWPRAWRWIQVLDQYREDLMDANPLSEMDSYATFFQIISRLQDDKETNDLIYATPGVRVVVTRAWALFLDNQSNSEADLVGICRFVAADTLTSANTAEILVGAGRRDEDLARLFVSHLHFAVPGPDHIASGETLVLLGGVIRLLKGINRNENWRNALLSQGIIKSLVLTMVCLSVPSVDGTEDMLDDCFIILVRILAVARQHQHLVDALQAGLLHAIVLSRSANPSVESFLTSILPRATVYYSALKQIDEELEKVEDLTQTSRFRASEVFQPWTKFVEFTGSRFVVMRRYDNGDWSSGSNCGNSACGKWITKRDRKRCTRCETSLYCSVECQRLDWQAGHRKVCGPLRSLFLKDPELTSTRDRSFLTALAHYDYLTLKATLYVRRISMMNHLPGRGWPLCTILDYTKGAVTTNIVVATSLGPVSQAFQTLWDENAARASRSGGRMHLVGLRLPEGDGTRYWVLPMWSQTSVQDEIEDIANSLPKGLSLGNSGYEPELRRRVAALLKQDGCDAKLI
ncbi:hypothetical protein DFH07DRAFT_823194 [Mycena maculata]|uniref:MYND-type domain-containing protein n=1 Tax=Mycena maculata TaxID=230809 RepID=A0AAD7J1R6_9AGAR|nr:hypothetical protein DFH07DRAFT_823194 [Mycena maculata]